MSPNRVPCFRFRSLRFCCGVVLGVAVAMPASALTVNIDYTHDVSGDNFFGMFPMAKAALEKAAMDVGALISSEPAEISNDYFVGMSGAAEVVFDLDLRYRDPSLGIMRQVDIPFLAAGEVIVYVGSQSLTENNLGSSEISTVKNTIFANVAGSPAEMQAATGVAAADAEAVWRRGGEGPAFNTLAGPISLGGTPVDFTAEMGPLAASVWFDTDTNNDGDEDSAAQLAAYWHFDHTTLPPANKFDFYSTALHELLHGIGAGTSQTHGLLLGSSGGQTTWLGPAGQEENGGSAFNLAHADGQHLYDGLMSTRLTDGMPQEVALDPTIGTGQRKQLTRMDAMILRDLGWTVAVPVPEPGVLVWLGLFLGFRRRRVGNS